MSTTTLAFAAHAGAPIVTGTFRIGPYEAKLVHHAEQRRHALATNVVGQLARLRASIHRLDEELNHEAGEMRALRTVIHGPERRPFEPALNPKLYGVSIIALLGAELLLTKLALDSVVGDDVTAWSSAIWFAFATLWAAKYSARVLRQKLWAVREWASCALAVGATTFITISLIGLALTRHFQLQAAPVIEGKFTPDAVGAPLVLFGFQMLAFLVCGLMSYFQTDPETERELASKQLKTCATRVEALWSERTRLADQHNKLVLSTEVQLSLLIHDARDCVSEYRDGNFDYRADTPPAFMRAALPPELFQPIDLGPPVDPHPLSVTDVVTLPQRGLV